MKTIPTVVLAKPESFPDLLVKSHTGRQSRVADQNRQFRPLSIDRSERSLSNATGQSPSPTPGELVPTCDANAPEAVDAIAAVILNAEAGLNWLAAEKPDLAQVRKVLSAIADDARRAAEIVQRLRTP